MNNTDNYFESLSELLRRCLTLPDSEIGASRPLAIRIVGPAAPPAIVSVRLL
jgi:hypothetical protein